MAESVCRFPQKREIPVLFRSPFFPFDEETFYVGDVFIYTYMRARDCSQACDGSAIEARIRLWAAHTWRSASGKDAATVSYFPIHSGRKEERRRVDL